MKRLLVISDYRDYHTARPEAAIWHGLVKRGFEIWVMSYGDCQHMKEFKEAGIHTIDFHPQKKFDKAEIQRIRQTLIDLKIYILHVFNSVSTVNGVKAVKGLPVKLVLYRGYSANIHWWDPTAYIKYLHPRVDKIFCNSVGVEEMFRRQLFFKKSKAITINKGHDLNWYTGYEKHDIRKELGLAEDSFLLINVSNNRRMKGIPYLLKANNLLPEDLNLHILLVGRNMDDKQNMAILKGSKRADKVHMLGFRKDVLNIVASSDVFILPSIKGESITKSVIESMSIGVPAIISDIRGNVELLKDGSSGWVSPARDVEKLKATILKVYSEKDRLQAYGEAARRHILTELNTQQTVEKTEAMYKGLFK